MIEAVLDPLAVGGQHLVGNHHAFKRIHVPGIKRKGNRHGFHSAARLDCGAKNPGSAVGSGNQCRIVWVYRRGFSCHQQPPGFDLHHYRGCPLGIEIVDGVCQHLLSKELQVGVNRQVESSAILCGLSGYRRTWYPNIIDAPLIGLLAIDAGEATVELPLKAL